LVVETSLETAATRWPKFAPRAVAAGYRSVHAFPLRLRQEIIGAMNLFGTGDLDPSSARLVQALADLATIGLLQEGAIRRREVLPEQLQTALNSRIVVEQAKGALAQIHSITPDEAFELMRGYCRWHNLRLGVVARAVTTDSASVADLITPYLSGGEAQPLQLPVHVGSPDADTLVVTLAGEADFSTASDLRQALNEAIDADRSHVIVDLNRLTFLDATILRVLGEARLRISASGGTLRVRGRTGHIRRMLSITGFDGMLDDRA
jgi:anti-anti-sigma factor